MLAREQEARQEAEALNRTKDQLLATVSHELRTPLNAIFGWAHMIQTAGSDEALRTRGDQRHPEKRVCPGPPRGGSS